MTFDELNQMLADKEAAGLPLPNVWLAFAGAGEPPIFIIDESEDKMAKKPSKMQAKVGKVMHEWKAGDLHSGSKKGPVVKGQKQAVAIALSEGRKAGKGKKR